MTQFISANQLVEHSYHHTEIIVKVRRMVSFYRVLRHISLSRLRYEVAQKEWIFLYYYESAYRIEFGVDKKYEKNYQIFRYCGELDSFLS